MLQSPGSARPSGPTGNTPRGQARPGRIFPKSELIWNLTEPDLTPFVRSPLLVAFGCIGPIAIAYKFARAITTYTYLTLLVAGSWLPQVAGGGGGGLFRTPLRSQVLTGRFLKFKRHSFRLNMIYISKKKKFPKFVEGGIRGAKTMNFRYFFDHVLPACL